MPINICDKGCGNVVEIPAECKGNVSIFIDGDFNFVEIKNLRRVDNFKLTISGNNSKFIMDPFRVGMLRVGIKNGGVVTIGSGTSIEEAYLLADHAKKIEIGNDCMISYNVKIRTTDSHGIYQILDGSRINFPNDIFIDDHVWLGQSVIVSKGAYISRNSVVGAMSFVAGKKFPPSCIVAGVPAKIIRRNIIWDRRECDRVHIEDESMDPRFKCWWNIALNDFDLS